MKMENSYKDLSAEIKEVAKKVLAEEDVDQLLGFAQGEFSGLTEPVIIKKAEQAQRMVFTEDATPMLSKYLLEYKEKKQAVVAKPCDTRAIAYYLSEDIIDRKNLVIIGINGCPGLKDNTACDECDTRNPVISDYQVGEEISSAELAAELKGVKYLLEDMTPAERKEHYSQEFARCTQCYACRDACPVCYCDHCYVESNQPEWVEEGSSADKDMIFHLMRTMHMPGRCVNCGACEMACPEGIDMRSMTTHLYHKAEELYDFRPGISPEQPPLLSDFSKEDSEPGFL